MTGSLSLSNFLGQDILISGKSTHVHRPHLHNSIGASLTSSKWRELSDK